MLHTSASLPIRVDLCGVETENLLGDANDSGECLVDFESCYVLNSQVSFLESDGKGNGRCDGEVDRLDTGIRECCHHA